MVFQEISRWHSLSTKLLISIILWIICAVIFTGYTLVLSWQLENGGIAINDAGSLRMRTYHMVTLLGENTDKIRLQKEQQNFKSILDSLKAVERNNFLFTEDFSISNQIKKIKQVWLHKMQPLLNQYNVTNNKISKNDLLEVDEFVDEINSLVKFIELQNTQHISWLRFIQALLIAMVLFSAFSAIYLLYRLVIRPLRQLQEGIGHVSMGNLKNRIPIIRQDEFGVVSLGFNKMAANLEDLYSNLEEKVHEKTAALEEKNHELSALYGITAFLHESHTQEIMTKGFLNHIIKLSGADAGSIRLLDKSHYRLNYICSQNLPETLLSASNCSSLTDCYCGVLTQQSSTQFKCIQMLDGQVNRVPCVKTEFASFMVFHLRHNNREIGIMTLYFNAAKRSLSEQTQYLIEILTIQLTVAIENQQLALNDKQLAVMEERNLIAQGLHDSIAQSLSFLNLQVQMLQTALAENKTAQVDKTLGFIQQGIQESYDDVRELLLNFRTRIHDEEFNDVVHTLLDRFRQQAKVYVQLELSGNGPSLNPQQQLQVIFILQEALSNVRKHAHCSHVLVAIENNEQFTMSIEDNGCGFDLKTIDQKKTQHVGMSIMKERTTQIAGQIDINSIVHQGTQVMLTIPKEQRGIL